MMLGFIAQAQQTTIVLDDELEDARWFYLDLQNMRSSQHKNGYTIPNWLRSRHLLSISSSLVCHNKPFPICPNAQFKRSNQLHWETKPWLLSPPIMNTKTCKSFQQFFCSSQSTHLD